MAYSEISRALIKAGAAVKTTLLLLVRSNFEDQEDRIAALEALGLVVPTGVILRRGTTTVPDGYLACDGSAVSRTTYATLFGIIGTAFGVGNGSTTFNVPDLMGRVPIGAGTGSYVGATARTLGAKLGAETHALVLAELPAHTHTVTEPNAGQGHRHQPALQKSGAGGTVTTSDTYSTDLQNLNNHATSSTTPSISVGNTGSGTAHQNMQPSLVCAYMIKT